MSADWVTALDGLASGGLIDYDAAAYIMGQPARYVGHPSPADLPPTMYPLLPAGTKIKQAPDTDGFDKNGHIVKNPKWKKWALAGVAIGAVLLAILGRKKIKLPKLDGVKTFFTDKWQKISEAVSKIFKKAPTTSAP